MAKRGSPPKRVDQGIVEGLWKNPRAEQWDRFAQLLSESGARYYRIFFPAGLENSSALRDSYAMVYDGGYRPMFKIPIMKRSGKTVEGATIYLKALDLNRKAV